MDDELVLVTTDPGGGFEDRYVFVDWGDEFRDMHAQQMPKFMEPRTSVSIGFFGPSYLIAANAAGFLPRRLAEPHLEAGFLKVVPDAPTLTFPSASMAPALAILKAKAELAASGALPKPFWSRPPE